MLKGVETKYIRSVLPYLGDGVFRHVDKHASVEQGILRVPERGVGRYSLPKAHQRSEFYQGTDSYNPRDGEMTRSRKRIREQQNRSLYR